MTVEEARRILQTDRSRNICSAYRSSRASRTHGAMPIDDVLSPPPPSACATPVLLIRNADTGVWFAADIQKFHNNQ
jgi:hypothetical protein